MKFKDNIMTAILQDLSPGKLKILKAVSSLLEDPENRITISRIAGKVSVTEAAIYRHYRSKDDIFQALMSYMEANLIAPLNYVQKEIEGSDERLKIVFQKYLDFLEGHPGLARLFLGHGTSEATGVTDKVQMLHAKVRGQILMILRRADAQGDLESKIAPDSAAELFYGLIVGASMAQGFGLPQTEAEDRWSTFAQGVFKDA